MFIVSASGGQKNTILGKFWHFSELLYRSSFTDDGQVWCAIADLRYTFMCEISSRWVYSVVLCWRKTPIVAVFRTSAFSGVASWQQSEKVEHECPTTNLPLYNGTISDVQTRDRQTNRQNKKLKICQKLWFLATEQWTHSHEIWRVNLLHPLPASSPSFPPSSSNTPI